MAEDSFGREYLEGRQRAEAEDNLRLIGGATSDPQQAAQPAAEAKPPTPELELAPDRTAPGAVSRGASQVVGGVRDAVVEAGQSIEGLATWLRENVHGLPEGPKLQVKLPKVREPQGTVESLIRSGSQFLTAFVPLFKVSRAAGLGVGAAGGAAGVATDVLAFDPHDPRVSNLINEMAPALSNPITEYLAAKPEDSAAEGKFKNAVEGLGLGVVADGIFRTVKALKGAKALKPEELAGVLKSEAGRVQFAGGEPATAVKPKRLVEIQQASPEELKAFMQADPTAIDLGDRVLRVSWEQLGDQRGLEEVVNRTTQAFRQRIEVARRGKISDPALRQLAADVGMRVEDFLSRRTGGALNAEQSLALVNLLGASAKRLRGLAGQVAGGNKELEQGLLDQLSVHAAIQEQAFGVRAEAGRALRVWGMQADGTIAHATRLAEQVERIKSGEMLGGGPLTAERLAHMVLQVESPEQLAKLTREATKPTWTDMAMEVWINALLSNPTTHAANFISNMLTAVRAVPERYLASMSGQEVAKGEASALFYGMVGSVMDAYRIAGRAMREGTPIRPGTKLEGQTRKAISAGNFENAGDWGRAIDLIGTTARLPGRFLMAADEFWKVVNFQGEVRAQALRQARNEGLTGKELGTRVAVLQSDPDFLARVKPLADEFAEYQTFTRPLGEFGSAIMSARDAHPAAKLVVPFLRTPIDLFKDIGAHTPVLWRLSNQVRADMAAGGARADMAKARIQMGGMTMAATATLAASGYITGRGPRDPALRREWLETHQPYSVKVGGKWISYNRLDPIGALLGMASDFSDMSGHLDEVSAGQVAAAMTLAVSNNMLSKTYIKGIADVMDLIQSPVGEGAGIAKRMIGSTLQPFSGVAAVARLVDPTVKDVQSITDGIFARLPGFSKLVPAQQNLWAEQIHLDGGLGPDIISPLYTKSIKPHPASEEMTRLEMSVAMPGRTIFGPAPAGDPLRPVKPSDGVPLEPDEYAKYVRLSAGVGIPGLPTLRQAIESLIATPGYKTDMTDGPDGTKQREIRKIIRVYREMGQKILIAESPALQQQFARKALERANAQVPAATIPKPTGLPGAARQGNPDGAIQDLIRSSGGARGPAAGSLTR